MNREQIIRMAEEVGGFLGEMPRGDAWLFTEDEHLERFAALVASAAVRETSAEYRLGWNDGQIAEREKSLKLWMLLDDIDTADDIAKTDHDTYRRLCRNTQQRRWAVLSESEVDAAIRARGQA